MNGGAGGAGGACGVCGACGARGVRGAVGASGASGASWLIDWGGGGAGVWSCWSRRAAGDGEGECGWGRLMTLMGREAKEL